jgi:FkbM family methyltransferase
MLRRLAERLARGRVIRRHLPRRFARLPIYVSPDARLQLLKPGEAAFDPQLLRIAEEEISPGDVVWDIGANVGVFTLAAAAMAGRGVFVLGVEPDPMLAGLLNRSAARARDRGYDVHVLSAAIADTDGAARLLISARGRASNALDRAGGRSQMGGVREQVLVPQLKLDTLLGQVPAPGFLKIDVEGAEALVLAGARRLLEEIRPIVYVEVGRAAASQATGILRDCDYLLLDAAEPKAARRPHAECGFETLAVPRERFSGPDGA